MIDPFSWLLCYFSVFQIIIALLSWVSFADLWASLTEFDDDAVHRHETSLFPAIRSVLHTFCKLYTLVKGAE